jgi:hypothetical protein
MRSPVSGRALGECNAITNRSCGERLVDLVKVSVTTPGFLRVLVLNGSLSACQHGLSRVENPEGCKEIGHFRCGDSTNSVNFYTPSWPPDCHNGCPVRPAARAGILFLNRGRQSPKQQRRVLRWAPFIMAISEYFSKAPGNPRRPRVQSLGLTCHRDLHRPGQTGLWQKNGIPHAVAASSVCSQDAYRAAARLASSNSQTCAANCSWMEAWAFANWPIT